eukprot:COSAG04_NODE_5268_length_1680_cov_1.199241_1_plen_224_part_10
MGPPAGRGASLAATILVGSSSLLLPHGQAGEAAGSLYSRLAAIPFRTPSGAVNATSRFTHELHCVDFFEPENVSAAFAAWAGPGFSYPRPYLWQVGGDGALLHPPTGMRSAVPLGGVGCGSLELRADGSFHEWTIENMSPAGGAKLGPAALHDAMLGLWARGQQGTTATALRTDPPAGIPAAPTLTYDGLFPASRLTLGGSAPVDASLYALSAFRIFELEQSNS